MGVEVNDRAEIIMDDGRPAQNLYAAGEVMAGNVLGQGYLAGIGMTIGGVFGRIAGASASRRLNKTPQRTYEDIMTVNLISLAETPADREVARIMQICNACRYCEGFCAVFPAMERRREFAPVIRRRWPIFAIIAAPAITPASMHRRMNLPLMSPSLCRAAR